MASESVAIEGTGHTAHARRRAGRGDLHRPRRARSTRGSAPSTPSAEPVHVRVRLPGAARLGDGRHLGLPGAPQPGRDAGAARDLDHPAERRSTSSSRSPNRAGPSAMQLAQRIGKPYREGFVKNRYVGRTFIMPGQGVRKKSVRQKLNAIDVEFKGRNVLLVDDSIVRGTTSQGDRADGARRRRAQGLHRLGRAAGALPERLRHRHADHRRADRARPQRSRRSASSSAPTR